jgi:D-proline reductase (dithiol) PrdB
MPSQTPKQNRRQRMNRAVGALLTEVPAVARLWGKMAGSRMARATEDSPWTPPKKPLREARLVLITTGGLHLKADEPFDMQDPHGDPSFRAIPSGVPDHEITVTHDYYNHRSVRRDINILLPRDRVRELVDRGVLGSLHREMVSFMGHIEDRYVDVLRHRMARDLAQRLVSEEVDLALLTPA